MPARVTKNNSGNNSYFANGQNNVICDRTGFKVKSGDTRREWNGLVVRKESFERRQPLDLLQSIPDDQSPAVSRPDTDPVFLSAGEVKASDL